MALSPLLWAPTLDLSAVSENTLALSMEHVEYNGHFHEPHQPREIERDSERESCLIRRG